MEIKSKKQMRKIKYQTSNTSIAFPLVIIILCHHSSRVAPETAIPHKNQSLCLITAAQAAHWFDLKQFYAEVNRTLKPMGVLAIYGYGLVQATGENSKQLNEIIQTVSSIID